MTTKIPSFPQKSLIWSFHACVTASWLLCIFLPKHILCNVVRDRIQWVIWSFCFCVAVLVFSPLYFNNCSTNIVRLWNCCHCEVKKKIILPCFVCPSPSMLYIPSVTRLISFRRWVIICAWLCVKLDDSNINSLLPPDRGTEIALPSFSSCLRRKHPSILGFLL